MAETTNIAWCDATVNHWWGCTEVSAGCGRCYAKSYARFRAPGGAKSVTWGKGEDRVRVKGAPALLRKLNRRAAREGRSLVVFHNSMSDFFDPEVPVSWVREAWGMILTAPNLVHLLLTKRPECVPTRLAAAQAGAVPANVWIGTTVERAEYAARTDLPHIRWASCEPLLGPIDPGWLNVDWVIAGGESGPLARPCDVDWLRAFTEHRQPGMSVFIKQLGEPTAKRLGLESAHGDIPEEWPESLADLRVREFPDWSSR